MRIVHVKILLITLTTIVFSGCTEIYFSQCKTPNIDKPLINNNRCSTAECVYTKVLTNYESMKEYASLLEEANKVCK